MESVDPFLLSLLPKDVKNLFFPYTSVQLLALSLNLLLGYFFASLIGWHFRRYSSAFCNRQDFSRLFVLLMLSIILIITVVKSSLALALGLVGALSIVRFRTPIKEPEELLYLFLNIAVAVSLGAGQTLAASVACVLILLLATLAKKRQSLVQDEHGMFLNLNLDNSEGVNFSVATLKDLIAPHAQQMELRRFDRSEQQASATFFLSVVDPDSLDKMIQSLEEEYPGLRVSLLEQHNIAGV